MYITFIIPGPLREYSQNKSEVVIESKAGTVGELLSELWISYLGLRDRVVTEKNMVRRHINIFVGDENIRYTGGLDTPISNSIEIFIIPAVSGG